jgi:dissimilatory sulfite reductase (desulfoviridin) alpha/beta subunit
MRINGEAINATIAPTPKAMHCANNCEFTLDTAAIEKQAIAIGGQMNNPKRRMIFLRLLSLSAAFQSVNERV